MKSVLLIDSDEIMRETIADILDSESLKIINAKDKLDGIKIVCTKCIDLVITNVSETDGVILVQTIKKIMPTLPVITISNGSIISSRTKCEGECSSNSIVIKSCPLSIDNLIDEVSQILLTNSTVT
ncbi:MAG: response regulator [Bacteroidales bacterium]|nr:MAG: response regulator [Bacteroidales bacterium]